MSDELSITSISVFVATAALSTIRIHYQQRCTSQKSIDSRAIYVRNSASDEEIYIVKRTRNRLSFDLTHDPDDHNWHRKDHLNRHCHFEHSSHQPSTFEAKRELQSYLDLNDLIQGDSEDIIPEMDLDEKIDLGSIRTRCINLIKRAVSSFNEYNSSDNADGDESDSSRFAGWRSNYNSKIMPDRIVMVRHGQSEGNVNEALYNEQPDNNIRLTKLGWEQAKMAGRTLRNQILQKENCNDSVHFIVSPYVRTIETFHGLAAAWSDPDEDFSHIENLELRKVLWYKRLEEMGVTWHEDPRIREQDFGNFQKTEVMKKAKGERYKFGVFYYRFPNGESASDVYDRASTFLDSLWRSFDANRAQNYILVTHGISIRVLLTRYFRYSIDQFNMMANPRNCEMVILGHDGNGKLQLDGRCELQLSKKENRQGNEGMDGGKDETLITGVKFYKKLRIVPKDHMRSRTVRLSCG
jgi:broad specificity phosphatase PhoE